MQFRGVSNSLKDHKCVIIHYVCKVGAVYPMTGEDMILFRWILAILLVFPVGYLCYYLYMRVVKYVLGDSAKSKAPAVSKDKRAKGIKRK